MTALHPRAYRGRHPLLVGRMMPTTTTIEIEYIEGTTPQPRLELPFAWLVELFIREFIMRIELTCFTSIHNSIWFTQPLTK